MTTKKQEQERSPDAFIRRDGVTTRRPLTVKFEGEGRTVQSAERESNINTIMDRWRNTGALPVSTRVGRFMDCTGVSDYQSALNIVHQAESAFLDLPAAVRQRMGNNPAELVRFMQDEANLEAAAELGLLERTPELEAELQRRVRARYAEPEGPSEPSPPGPAEGPPASPGGAPGGAHRAD